MLEQVLQQIGSRPEAKSNQSQRQRVSARLSGVIHVETSHHFVTLVGVRAPLATSAAGVAAGPVDEMMTGLFIIEGIDLDAEVPCAHLRQGRDCGRPADLLARTCSGNIHGVCLSHWNDSANSTGRCPETGLFEMRDEHYTIVEVLR